MWFLVYIFTVIVIIFLLAEEAIYFFVNRYVFGKSNLERKCGSWIKQVREKIKIKRNAS
ncbi:hypothetical protein [Bacillus sp. S/N-304-OC-R1]|uniref:hypothetical protein n=1 Tax=Bacillus sp. S/N-304-OC-R1 TaxID=2758034 RepID=UPI001C8ED9C2|nr:hypothetical protein [Bacillus sp. S/N-304-OC-R1]MBY0121366.1 hypothetical protein [Bacillus sp. S/N-304-OC-R1]